MSTSRVLESESIPLGASPVSEKNQSGAQSELMVFPQTRPFKSHF